MSNYTSIVSTNNVVDITFFPTYTVTPAIFVLNKYSAENSDDWYGELQNVSNSSFRFNTIKVKAQSTQINWTAIGYYYPIARKEIYLVPSEMLSARQVLTLNWLYSFEQILTETKSLLFVVFSTVGITI